MARTNGSTEMTRLLLIEADAEAMATRGQVARGFMLLTRELKRARAACQSPGSLSEALVQECQACIDAYSERHQMKSTAPGPRLWRVSLPDPAGETPRPGE